ncbi:MAG: TetR/AcrR family transcriptional regulator [Lachnospiraceae bacterium]|nr:TetR/AcrR family transcriptional regulator [Lachnospiraceae bacterium]
MAKQDIRVERSKDAIKGAFVELMKHREYEDITVKDLAEEARINRKTFYAHYETKQALFESMIREMFDEICSCFMYEKDSPEVDPEEEVLREDIRRFLRATEKYRERLDVMITDQTATMTFIVSEQVILQRAQAIHILKEMLPGRVPVELYIMRLKNFFLGVMDWWLGQQEYNLEEATEILYKTMRKNMSSVFRYERGR